VEVTWVRAAGLPIVFRAEFASLIRAGMWQKSLLSEDSLARVMTSFSDYLMIGCSH
jgi:hypothetical protein